jgi:hypothetical protein
MNELDEVYRRLLAESVRPVPRPAEEYPAGPTRWLAEDRAAEERAA